MPDYARRVRFTPYREGCGPRFTLTTWDDALPRPDGKNGLRYRLTQRGDDETGRKRTARVLFEGSDFGCSPLHANDSDETIAALMGFLTLRPGDTDREYFASYTPAQQEFAEQHAEALAVEVFARFGDA